MGTSATVPRGFGMVLVLASIVRCSAGVSPASRPATRRAEMRWGPEANGLRANLEVEGRDDYEYHPGESLRCVGVLENASDQTLRIPREASMVYARLHVRLPDGHHLVGPPRFRGGGFAGRPPWLNQLGDIRAGGTDLVYHNDIRLGDCVDDWADSATGRVTVPTSFRQLGQYEFWMTYAVPAGNAGAWSGDLSSNHVIINVSDLPPERRSKVPSTQQLAELDQLLGPGDGSVPHKGYPQLERAMLLTENEGLALRIVDLIQGDAALGRRLGFLVQERYGVWHGPGGGIDGPYLEHYAEATIEGVERGRPVGTVRFGGGGPAPDWAGVLAYLHFHPGPAKLRDRIVALARRSARIGSSTPVGSPASGSATRPSTRPAEDHVMSVPTAWQILMGGGSLPAGMKIVDAIDILGSPSVQETAEVEWRVVGNPGREDLSVTRLTASRDGDTLGQFHLSLRCTAREPFEHVDPGATGRPPKL